LIGPGAKVYRVLFLSASVLLGACQPVTVYRDPGGEAPVALRVDDAAYWLEEWRQVLSLPDDQLQQVLRSREQAFGRDGDVRSRLRLALLLAEGPPLVRDRLRALSLLQSVDPEAAGGSAGALAVLLRQTVSAQVSAEGKIKRLRQDLALREQRIAELERQLQEVTDIEQSIQQRETPVDRKE
jgi:hypothetical protein